MRYPTSILLEKSILFLSATQRNERIRVKFKKQEIQLGFSGENETLGDFMGGG
jgi:hypothetical protein